MPIVRKMKRYLKAVTGIRLAGNRKDWKDARADQIIDGMLALRAHGLSISKVEALLETRFAERGAPVKLKRKATKWK